MKFYKFKQVQRLVFFGSDDVLTSYTSLSKRSKKSRVAVLNDTKTLRFNFVGKNGVQLSNNARIVIESLYLPTEIYLPDTTINERRQGPVTIRANNLQGDTFDSTDNNANSPLLFTSQTLGEFHNTYPKILYNFNVSQQFFTNGYLELEITYPNVEVAVNSAQGRGAFEDFYISFIIYDVNEEELVLKDTAEVDYKDMQSHLPTNLGMLGVIPNDDSRYSTKTTKKTKKK